jgi:RecA/RadA recombinase
MAYLAAVFIEGDLFVADCIRELTPNEYSEFHSIHTKFNVLRQRLSLLHILEQNFSTLDGFINQLQTSESLNATRVLSEVKLV